MFVSLAMGLADRGVLLGEEFQAWLEGVGDLEVVIEALGRVLAIEADLHLLDRRDEGFGLLGQFMFLAARSVVIISPKDVLGHQAQLALEGLGQGGEQFGLSGVAIMARDADLVEQVPQLVDDGGDLLLEIAGVHRDHLSAPGCSGLWIRACKGSNLAMERRHAK
jgi:hypothetical protein